MFWTIRGQSFFGTYFYLDWSEQNNWIVERITQTMLHLNFTYSTQTIKPIEVPLDQRKYRGCKHQMQYIAPANGYHYANYLLSFCALLMNLNESNAKQAKVDKACGTQYWRCLYLWLCVVLLVFFLIAIVKMMVMALNYKVHVVFSHRSK